jgi:uncharacterized protein (DUF1697 family)
MGGSGPLGSRRVELVSMPTYIALLRGINVGGHGKLPMEKLRALCEGLGCEQVKTFIQSGNVVFKAAKGDPGTLSAKLEKKILAEFGFPVAVVTRTAAELGKIIEGNPFAKESRAEPAKVHVAFLSQAPTAEEVKALKAKTSENEQARCSGREVYLYYRDGMGQAKMTGAVIERVLGVKATARNWNTVTKLYEMAESL